MREVPAIDDPAPLRAGMQGAGDYRCLDCGYGIVTFSLIPRCPMCNGESWQRSRSSPFTTSRHGMQDLPTALP